MKKRFILFSAVILIISVLITAFASFRETEAIQRQTTREYMTAIANYLADEWIDTDDPRATAENLEPFYTDGSIPLRITIISEDGDVLFDNEKDPDELGNHLARPEVIQVMRSKQTGEAIRYSNTLKRDLFYHAKFVPEMNGIVRVSIPLASQTQAISAMRRNVLLVAAGGILLLMLFSTLFIRKITEPMKALTEAAETLSEGDWSKRVDTFSTTYPEWKKLTRTYNDMADTLEAQHNQLSRNRSWLYAILNGLKEPLVVVDRDLKIIYANRFALELFGRDIDPEENPFPLFLLTHEEIVDDWTRQIFKHKTSDRRKIDLQTVDEVKSFQLVFSPIDTNAVAIMFHDRSAEDAAQQWRSDFVANVTHELRTPLTSIRGFIETLQSDRPIPEDQRRKFLNIIDLESDRLERLIDDLLALSKIEHTKRVDAKEVFDVRVLIAEVAEQLKSYAADHHVTIIDESPQDPLLIQAERDHIKQILINLTDNAIKYGREGGHVWLGAELLVKPETIGQGGRIMLTVRDDGAGIEKKDIPRIFERFYRVDKSRSRSLGGTGLGLSIVKHLANLYGGVAEVESQVGVGTTFTVTLDA